MNVKFKQWDCVAVPGKYSNGRKAIQLIDAEDYECVAVATVNLPDSPLEDDNVFVKDYSENLGMAIALIKSDVIYSGAQEIVHSEWLTIYAYKLTEKALKEIFK